MIKKYNNVLIRSCWLCSLNECMVSEINNISAAKLILGINLEFRVIFVKIMLTLWICDHASMLLNSFCTFELVLWIKVTLLKEVKNEVNQDTFLKTRIVLKRWWKYIKFNLTIYYVLPIIIFNCFGCQNLKKGPSFSP